MNNLDVSGHFLDDASDSFSRRLLEFLANQAEEQESTTVSLADMKNHLAIMDEDGFADRISGSLDRLTKAGLISTESAGVGRWSIRFMPLPTGSV